MCRIIDADYSASKEKWGHSGALEADLMWNLDSKLRDKTTSLVLFPNKMWQNSGVSNCCVSIHVLHSIVVK